MTAPLVVRAGEQIVCPGCQAVLLTFEQDVHGREALLDLGEWTGWRGLGGE